MKKSIEKIIRQFRNNDSLIKRMENLSILMDDSYCLNLLQPLLGDKEYLPFNGGTLRPLGMAFILNEILINKREKILEFGAGFSTILIARLIKRNNLKLKFYSIEHNIDWLRYIEKELLEEGLTENVILIHSDLKNNNSEIYLNWYNVELITKELEQTKFDFVIIDGPPAFKMENQFARLPVVNFLNGKLKDEFCILIDDSNRVGEKQIKSEISKNFYPIKCYSIGNTMTGIFKGNHFYSLPH